MCASGSGISNVAPDKRSPRQIRALSASDGLPFTGVNPTGDYLWVCPVHYRQYDPGLPVLP